MVSRRARGCASAQIRCSSQLELGNLPNMASIALLQLSPHEPTETDSEQLNSLIRSVGMGRRRFREGCGCCCRYCINCARALRIIMHKFVQIRATVARALGTLHTIPAGDHAPVRMNIPGDGPQYPQL